MLKILKNILLSLLITVILLEIVGFFVGRNDYFWPGRQLYVTSKAFRPLGGGLWTFTPNHEVQYAATWHLSYFARWVEYRCRFKTNRLGLIDTNFEASNTHADYLVLGDSFTEGHGGGAWLTRETIPQNFPVVLNAGLQGTGLATFNLFRKWLAHEVDIKNLVIVAISNDFKRPVPEEIWTDAECLDRGRCAPHELWWGNLDPKISNEDLLKLSDKRYDRRLIDEETQWHDTLKFFSFTYNIGTKIYGLVVPEPAGTYGFEKEFELGFQSLNEMRKDYPDLKIVLIPQRDEVGLLGVENLDTKRVKSFLSQNKFDYKFCNLGISDYMPIDGHPNEKGGKKLFECVAEVIRHSEENQKRLSSN